MYEMKVVCYCSSCEGIEWQIHSYTVEWILNHPGSSGFGKTVYDLLMAGF